MVEKYRRFDPAEFLESDEDFAIFLQDSAESGDPKVLRAAIALVAKARGMTEIAERVGISRQGLFKALSDLGNPSFDNVGKILDVLGYQIKVVPKAATGTKKPAATKKPARTSKKSVRHKSEPISA